MCLRARIAAVYGLPVAVLDKFRLDGKVAVVTGASSGLGVAFAVGLRRGGRRRRRSAPAAPTGCRRRRARSRRSAVAASPSTADVADARGLHARGRARRSRELGAVDVLVNNAGVGTAVPGDARDAGRLPARDRHQPQRLLLDGAGVRAGDEAAARASSTSARCSAPTTRRAPAGRLRLEQGGDHRPHARPRAAVDRPQGHPRQRARARLLPVRDDRAVPGRLPRRDDAPGARGPGRRARGARRRAALPGQRRVVAT